MHRDCASRSVECVIPLARLGRQRETWGALVVNFSPEDHAAVSAVATAAMLASATEGEEGRAPPYRSRDEYASQVLNYIISSSSALSGPRHGSLRFAHLQSTINSKILCEEPSGGYSTSTILSLSRQSFDSSSCKLSSPRCEENDGRCASA